MAEKLSVIIEISCDRTLFYMGPGCSKRRSRQSAAFASERRRLRRIKCAKGVPGKRKIQAAAPQRGYLKADWAKREDHQFGPLCSMRLEAGSYKAFSLFVCFDKTVISSLPLFQLQSIT